MGKKDLSSLALLFRSLCLIERRWECNWCADGKNTAEQRTMNHLLPELVVNLQWCTQQQRQRATKTNVAKVFHYGFSSRQEIQVLYRLIDLVVEHTCSSNGNSYSLRMARTIVCQTQLKITTFWAIRQINSLRQKEPINSTHWRFCWLLSLCQLFITALLSCSTVTIPAA